MAKALNPFNKKAADIPPKVQVKGNAESVYRTGNVNLTPANIGAAGAPLWTDILIYHFLSIEGGSSGEGFPVPAIIKANGQLVCGWKTRSWDVGLDGSYQDLYGVHCMVVMSGRGPNWPAV